MLLFINYHRIAEQPDERDVHVLSEAQFDRQINLITSSHILFADASNLGLDEATPNSMYRLAITFDDGFLSDLKSAEKLANRGLSATFFVSTANLGKPGYLSIEHLSELIAMGMCIGSHSHDHIRLTELPLNEISRQLVHSKSILEQVTQASVDRFAFPGGAWSKEILQCAIVAGYRYMFGTAWGTHTPGSQDTPICRFNIVQGMQDRSFQRLIELRDIRRRRLFYMVKDGLYRILPEGLYKQLRSTIRR